MVKGSKNQPSADGLLQFTHHIPLAIPIIGFGATVRVIETIHSIRTNGPPQLMTTSTVKALFGLIVEQLQSPLQVFELSDSHQNEIKGLN